PLASDIRERLTSRPSRNEAGERRREGRRWGGISIGVKPHGVPPEDVLRQKARVDRGFVRRKACRNQTLPGGGDGLVQRHGSRYESVPVASRSFSERSCVIRLSMSSFRSPLSTSESWCVVKLMRWSVIRLCGKLYVRIFSERSPVPTWLRR